MTLVVEYPESQDTADGVDATFTVGFSFEADTELLVTVQVGAADPVTQVLGTDFSVSGDRRAGGAYLVFAAGSIPAAGAIVRRRRETPREQAVGFGDLAAFSPGLVGAQLDRVVRMVQELDRDLGEGGGGGGTGSGTAGVIAVNGRDGAVSLTAADVASGFGAAVGASLSPGLGISLATLGGMTVITATGGGGGGAVSSVAGRTGAVNLTAADVATGFGAAVAGSLAAGPNVSLVTSGGITTLNVTGPVASVAGKTGAVSLAPADITGFGTGVGSALAAGPNIIISTVAGVTTITAAIAAGGATVSSYVGASATGDFTSSSHSIAFPVGSNTGDLCVIIAGSDNTQPITPAGWSTAYSGRNTGYSNRYGLVAWKVLDAADITTGSVTVTGFGGGGNAGLGAVAYRGPNNLSIPVFKDRTSTSPVTLTGFTKHPSNIGTLTIGFDGDGGASSTLTGPGSPFTARLAQYSVAWSIFTKDAIGASVYPNGTNENWTFSGTEVPVVMLAELRNDGIPASTSAVGSVNGRTGAVTLTAADVASGMSAVVAPLFAAGAGISLVTSGGLTTITATGGGGGAVSSVAGRTGAVVLTAADVASGFGAAVGAALVAGPNISLVTSGGLTTISAAGGGGGGVPIGYQGSWEGGVTTGNVAATNTTNLNALIAALSAAGGGAIYFNTAGNYQINGTINLKSNVDLVMEPGAKLYWTGSASGTILSTSSTMVLTGLRDSRINVYEGAAFTGTVLMLHSASNNRLELIGLGQGDSSTFVHVSADSSAGEGAVTTPTRNTAFNHFHFRHEGKCGTGLLIDGIASGYGGGAQVVTLNTFHDTSFWNVVFRGIKIENWADSNIFTGFTYVGVSGAGGIGLAINEGRVSGDNYSVYNIHIQQLAVDTFGTVSPGRYGVAMNESKGITCDAFYQGPPAENGDLVGTYCTSYQFRHLVSTSGHPSGATGDTIVMRQKGIGTPTL